MSTNRPFVIVISPNYFNYEDLESVRDVQRIAVARYNNYAPWSMGFPNKNVAPGDVILPAVVVPKVPFIIPYADLKSAIMAHVEGKTGKIRFNVNDNC